MALIRYRRKRNVKGKVSYKIKRYVNKVVNRNIETKSIDIQSSATPSQGIGGSGFDLQLLNGIALGYQDYQRIGNTVKLQKMYLKLSTTFPDPTNIVRVMVLYDNSPDGIFPSGAQLFTFSADPLRSFITADYSSRFHVLYDKLISGGTGGPVAKALNPVTFKLKGKDMRFIGSGANIADIQRGAVYLIMMSDSLAANHPRVDYMARIFYKDG